MIQLRVQMFKQGRQKADRKMMAASLNKFYSKM